VYAARRAVFVGHWLDGEARAGEMRHVDDADAGDDDAAAAAAIVPAASAVRGRRPLPVLALADPAGVVGDAAARAGPRGSEEAEEDAAAAAAADGSGAGSAAAAAAAVAVAAAAAAAAAAGEELGLSPEETSQLTQAFAAGAQAALDLGLPVGRAADDGSVDALPADARLLGAMLSVLSVPAAPAEMEGLLAALVDATEGGDAAGAFALQAFFGVMAGLRTTQ
jgi:hypothetical protein